MVEELDMADVGHPMKRGLGRGIGDSPPPLSGRRGRGDEGGLGQHVHDSTLTALEHLGYEQLDQQERVEVIPDEALLGQFKGYVQDPIHGPRPLVDGVVEQHVDAAPPIECLRGHVADRLAVQ